MPAVDEVLEFSTRLDDITSQKYTFLLSVLQLLVTVSIVPSSLSLITLMIEELRSSETSVRRRSHGVTSKKTAFFIVAAVKTPNLT
jgi:hypothetical protein